MNNLKKLIKIKIENLSKKGNGDFKIMVNTYQEYESTGYSEFENEELFARSMRSNSHR